MEKHIVFKGGNRPPNSGFSTPHAAHQSDKEPAEAVNDSLGSIHPADTMDTEPDDDPEAGGKGDGPKAAE